MGEVYLDEQEEINYIIEELKKCKIALPSDEDAYRLVFLIVKLYDRFMAMRQGKPLDAKFEKLLKELQA